MIDPISDLRHFRNERSDWLLTVLTGVMTLMIFVFATLQAIGISAFHLFAIGLIARDHREHGDHFRQSRRPSF